MLGDIIYEGGRSIIPSYIESLGFTVLAAGLIFGLSDFTGYFTRLISGLLVDRFKFHWVFTVTGYLLVISIPLLGIFNSVDLIILFIFTERFGKGLRTPAKQTIFSILTKDIESAKAFGYAEALDQIGAVGGPLLISLALFNLSTIKASFLIMFYPYFILFITITSIYYFYHRETDKSLDEELQAHIAKNHGDSTKPQLSRKLKVFIVIIGLSTIFLFPVQLLLFTAGQTIKVWIVPLLYLAIQLIDGIFAVFVSQIYRKIGGYAFALVIFLSGLPLLFVALNSIYSYLAVTVIYGVIIGSQETIYKVKVVEETSLLNRGTGFGYLNFIIGVGLMSGNIMYGSLLHYTNSIYVLFAVVLVIQTVLSLIYLILDKEKASTTPETTSK